MIKVFKTVDTAVAYIEDNLGVKWNYEKEQKIRKEHVFTAKGVSVFVDEFGILG